MKLQRMFYCILSVLIVFIALFLIISILPIPGNYKFYVVQSGSMQPEIYRGSIIMVKPFGNYKIKDIITFYILEQKYMPMTHRIIDKIERNNQSFFITQGDANDGPDTYEVEQSEIIGKVIFKIPFIGYVIDAVRKPIRFFVKF